MLCLGRAEGSIKDLMPWGRRTGGAVAAKVKCDLTCPKCKKLWGELSFRFDSHVNPSDVKVVAGKKKKFKKGDTMACTCCGHPYTNCDVFIAIHESMGKK